MATTTIRRRTVEATDEGLYLQNGVDAELKLPKTGSLAIILAANLLMQMSFFIIVSSSNEYAQHLGGTSVFSGIVIGVPTAVSALVLVPLTRYDKGMYRRPLQISCAGAILGHILYAMAYYADFLYLILIGRMVNGVAFTFWMYNKRYCTDGRIVGVRRRTMLASWLVVTQGIGMSAGPFLGGILYKIGFSNPIFNGFTSPGWIMAGAWAVFWLCANKWFEDPPTEAEALAMQPPSEAVLMPSANPGTSGHDVVAPSSLSSHIESAPSRPLSFVHAMSPARWGVAFCMCWFAMTCFFVLGAWESNLPVFGADAPVFHWSPFAAGNFIALGGITAFPFLLANIFVARRMQDRHLLALGSGMGMLGLVVFIALLQAGKVSYGSLFVCWWFVALGFNLSSTVTISLLSKQLPAPWNGKSSMAIQYSMYTGRVTGAIWGGSGVKVGMKGYAGLEMGIVGFGILLLSVLWKDMKAKRG